MRPAVVVAVLAGVGLAGCSGSSHDSAPTTTTTRTQIVGTSSAPGSTSPVTPLAPSTRRALPPGKKPHAGEKAAACPYIKAGLNVTPNSGNNLADLEGDRVSRTTVLTTLRPVGCRFYFANPPYQAIAEIHPQTYGDATTAHNAMVLTAQTGHGLIVERNFTEGLTGICFQTQFLTTDGNKDWAFTFAKGQRLVTVYTQRKDTSRNALYIAQAIAAKF